MTKTGRWITRALAVATGLLGTAGSAGAQAAPSCSGVIVGDLGISGYRCAGEGCRMIFQMPEREAQATSGRPSGSSRGLWLFSTEPEIVDIRTGSPADGVLEPGDRLVAVNGSLITTRRASEALHDLEPGESVRVRFRRDGRVRDVRLEARARCDERARAPAAERVVVGRDASAAPGRGTGAVGSRAESTPAASSNPAAGRPSRTATPGVHLGMSFQCDYCVVETTEEGGVRWSFSRPIEVVQVEPDGPAARAGLAPGDLIRRIDGHPIESEEGGEAWGAMEAGEPVRLVISRPDGAFGDVEVVPEPRPTVSASGTLSLSESGLARLSRLQGALRNLSESLREDDAGTLRYTGFLDATAIEVRGRPVQVVKDEESGIITIYTDGNVIRIRSAGR